MSPLCFFLVPALPYDHHQLQIPECISDRTSASTCINAPIHHHDLAPKFGNTDSSRCGPQTRQQRDHSTPTMWPPPIRPPNMSSQLENSRLGIRKYTISVKLCHHLRALDRPSPQVICRQRQRKQSACPARQQWKHES